MTNQNIGVSDKKTDSPVDTTGSVPPITFNLSEDTRGLWAKCAEHIVYGDEAIGRSFNALYELGASDCVRHELLHTTELLHRPTTCSLIYRTEETDRALRDHLIEQQKLLLAEDNLRAAALADSVKE